MFFVRQIIRISLLALLANKVRSFLTMLGIIIGVASVIIIMSVGAGAQSLILSQVKSLGTNIVGIFPGKAEDKGPPSSAMGIVVTTLVYDDLEAIIKEIPHIIGAVAYTKGVGTVSWGTNSYDTNLSGCTVDYLKVEEGKIDQGRFFNKEEEKNLSKVAVLGDTVAHELFGEINPVGKRIKIKKHSFLVIGVMKKRGLVAFQDHDDQVFIPLLTMQKLISGVNHLGLIRVKVDDSKNINDVMEQIRELLRYRHNINDPSGESDDFTVRSADQVLDMITVITDALKYFLASIGALSLVVGGVGIMNIMLVNVAERTAEIGLRKAVGAKNVDIMGQFLAEVVTITLTGGIFGILSGVAISFTIAWLVNFFGYDWDFIISPLAILIAILVSAIVGIIFGIYPAYKASRLEPIEALRYE